VALVLMNECRRSQPLAHDWLNSRVWLESIFWLANSFSCAQVDCQKGVCVQGSMV